MSANGYAQEACKYFSDPTQIGVVRLYAKAGENNGSRGLSLTCSAHLGDLAMRNGTRWVADARGAGGEPIAPGIMQSVERESDAPSRFCFNQDCAVMSTGTTRSSPSRATSSRSWCVIAYPSRRVSSLTRYTLPRAHASAR